MKIKKLFIENYKIFKNFEIEFNDRLTVIVGINGSGKTSILEILNSFLTKNTKLKSDRDYIEIPIDSNLILESLKIGKNRADIDSNTNLRQYGITQSKIFYLKALQNNLNKTKKDIKNFFLNGYKQNEDQTVKAVEQSLINDINSTFNGLELITKFKSLSNDGKQEPIFENDLNKNIKLQDLSTGEQQLFSRALNLKMLNLKDSVILIDEPETSMHPKWQSNILKVYAKIANEGNNQLIVTTHSPHIISSTKKESMILLNKVGNKIEINRPDGSYGYQFDRILSEIMNLEYSRDIDVAKDIKLMWQYLQDEDLDKFESIYSNLVQIVGEFDEELLRAKFEKMKIKKRKNIND